jgi:hypothetical protein
MPFGFNESAYLQIGGWWFAREFCLRSAGFPAWQLEKFGDPMLKAVANDVCDVVEGFFNSSDSVVGEGIQGQADLRGGRSIADPDIKAFPFSASAYLLELSRECAIRADKASVGVESRAGLLHHAMRSFEREYSRSNNQASKLLVEASLDDRLQQALAWQNRDALENVAQAIGRDDGKGRPAKRRQREEKLALYLQRYCVKNESIGFFGPVGWGCWSDGVTSLRAHQELVTLRTASMEDWAVRALARSSASLPEALPWLVPTAKPYLWIRERNVVSSRGIVATLSWEEIEILKSCRNQRTARLVAAVALNNSLFRFSGQAEIYAILQRLGEKKIIDLEFPVAAGDFAALEKLIGAFNGIEEPALRSKLLSPVQDIRGQIGSIGGKELSAARTKQLLDSLDESFQAATGQNSHRRRGVTYGARTILFHDCRRAIDLQLNQAVLERAGPAIGIVLHMATWWCGLIGTKFDEWCLGTLRKLAGEQERDTGLPLPVFWLQAQGVLVHAFEDLIEAPTKDLRERWMRCLPTPASSGSAISVSSEALHSSLIKGAPLGETHWPASRQHSPDLLISAASVDAIGKGDYLLVLGELHAAANTMLTSALARTHPDPSSLASAQRSCSPRGRVHLRFSTEDIVYPLRTHFEIDSAIDFEVLMSEGARAINPVRSAAISDFMIAERDGVIRIFTRDRRESFLACEFFSQLLSQLVMNRYRPLSGQRYTPRVLVDELVVQRQEWSFGLHEFEFVDVESDADNFLYLRYLARSSGLPNHVFVSASWERKPFWLDISNAVYVRCFCKLLRAARRRSTAGTVRVSEALPGFDGLWLADAKSQKYTAELRTLAFCHSPLRS